MTVHDDRTDDRRAAAPVPVRQRWRLVYRRTAAAAGLSQRALETAWLAALEASGLPIAPTGPASSRPKVVFGPPIPVGAVGERELLDVYLRERVTAAEARRRLQPVLPTGCELIDVHDVWVGAPALPAAIVAVDFRVELDVGANERARVAKALRAAARALLSADRLQRIRVRGGRAREYDLRPFLVDLRLEPTDGDRICLAMRLRVAPEAGAGRPDEVVRALLEATTDEGALALLRRASEDWLARSSVGLLTAAPADGEAGRTGFAGGVAAPPVPPGWATATPEGAPPGAGDTAAVFGGATAPRGGRPLLVVRERLVTTDEVGSAAAGGRLGAPGHDRPSAQEAPAPGPLRRDEEDPSPAFAPEDGGRPGAV